MRNLFVILSLSLNGLLFAYEQSEPKEARLDNAKNVNWKQVIYSRNAQNILESTITDPENDGSFNFGMFKFFVNNKPVFFLCMRDGHVQSLFTTPHAKNITVAVDDKNKDTFPDFIDIMDLETHQTLDAFTLSNGNIEPLSDELLKKYAERSDPSVEDDLIPELINRMLSNKK